MNDKEGSKRNKHWYNPLVPRSGERKAFLISLGLLLLVITMLVLEYVPRVTRFEAGKPSTETVISSRDFSFVDEESTEIEREAERRRIKGLFIDPAAQAEAVDDLNNFLSNARAISEEEGDIEEKMAALELQGWQDIDPVVLETVLTISQDEATLLYTTVVDLVTSAMSDPVSYDNLSDIRDDIRKRARVLSLSEDLKYTAAGLATAFARTNVDFSAATIKGDMEAAGGAVEEVLVKFAVGQKIVEKGEIITPLTLESLSEAGALSPVGNYQQVMGISLLVLALYAMTILFFKRFRPDIAGSWRVVAMICLVFLTFCLFCRLFSILADENPLWGYLIPLALVGMTLSILNDHLVALFMVIMGGVLTGLLLKGNFYLTVAALLGGLAGVVLVKNIRTRENLMRCAAEASLVIAVVSMITASLTKDMNFILLAGLLGLGTGVLTGLLTLGSLPGLERISGITTPIHLLELVSPDQPLMKELISKAPGTYSHSVIVGNLADAAAREMGADPLLARVGAYYHDVGKTKRSTFFVENQPQGFNGHEKLKPNLSALVITAHVKEGVELANEHHLPQDVVDIISQHHGTSLIRYFYARALEENGGTDVVSESRFRYPAEKPQSKEAAVVMLADAIEAAAKAMGKPTPVKLEQLTRSLIEERLKDGQLSESNLTMGDVDKMTKAFVRILFSMYHERVEYPVLVKEEGVS